jgi:predicted metal-dependent HD superfamily phosphohydrolase
MTKRASSHCESNVDLRASWLRGWHRVGAAGDGDDAFGKLLAGYNEAHRRYHTIQHLSECLAAFEQAIHLAPHPAEVEIALWFHDAIYDVTRDDNEERSAEWATAELEAAGAPAHAAERVSALVLATRHTAVRVTMDEQVLVDIDLGILGASEQRFAEYERQIRDEYAFVPSARFRRERRAILLSFLQRPRIYGTAHFHALLEEGARRNLQRAIS